MRNLIHGSCCFVLFYVSSPRHPVFWTNFTPPLRGVLLFGHPIINMTRITYGFSFPLKPYVVWLAPPQCGVFFGPERISTRTPIRREISHDQKFRHKIILGFGDG